MTRRSTVPRSRSTRISRSRLALAISCGVLALASLPVSAQTSSSGNTQSAVESAISGAFFNSRATPSTTQPILFTDGFTARWRLRDDAQASSASTGVAPRAMSAAMPSQPTDPTSWVTEEFQADWGLEVINAHHAYARGLSGAGVRLGLLDSGAGFDHPEFAGKDHRAITMADVLEDGTLCAQQGALGGPDACFYTKGDEAAVSGLYLDEELRPFVNPGFEDCIGQVCYSYESHGTHVAGTMAANRDGTGMHGVAWGADLSSARLFSDSYEEIDVLCAFANIGCVSLSMGASTSALVGMYDQAIAHGVRAMNHSWGWGYTIRDNATVHAVLDGLEASNPGIYEQLAAMAEASRQSGMLQVVAAGNTDAPGATLEEQPITTIPGMTPYLFPDIEKYWVAVANLNEDGVLSAGSMRCGAAAQWCITAPGTNITSSVLDGGPTGTDIVVDDAGNVRYEFEDRNGGVEYAYADYTGTSMAAPHVTGALGLLFERFPYLEGHQIRDVMLTTATDLGEEGVDDIYGWGLLNLEKAIEGYGQLRVDTDIVMDQAAGGIKVWDGDAWDDWTNDIGGPGRLGFHSNTGGWLRLSGDNSFNGATVTGGTLELAGRNALADDVLVQGGRLLIAEDGRLQDTALTVTGVVDAQSGAILGRGVAIVNGTVAGGQTRVEALGTLGGSGTLGDTWVAGTIAPGNSIGTLVIDGDYVQTADATLVAELQPPNLSDLLSVTGSATLYGGTLVASRLPGTYLLGQQYRIVSAQGGVTGTFDSVDSSALSPFLSLSLLYGPNAIDVGVARGAALATAAQTGNQRTTATALDALPDNQGLLVPLTQLGEADARNAFDQLSGEIHASAQQVLIDSGRLVRDAALARAGNDGFRGQRDIDAHTGAWVEVHRQGGRVGGDGNAARAQYNGTAVLVGVDHQLDGGWRVGALGGVGSTDFDVRGRASKGDADTRHVGVYGTRAWHGLALRAGYTYAWHELDIERDVAFAGFADGVHGRYDATAWQAFAELGYRFGNERWELEPYLQYAHVELDHDGFAEDGGAAALRGRDGDTRVDLTTAGVRFNVNLRGTAQDQSWLSLRGNLGYRYAGGNQVHDAQLSFDGSRWYGVTSPSIADEATLVELGIAARTSANSLLELGYSGALSDDARDHGASARFSLQF